MPDAALQVDPRDPTPPYEQVRRQLEDLIRAGILRAGDRLPPLRQLAGDLGLAVGTVGRAYAELETQGLVVSRRGAGTRVADAVTPGPDAVLRQLTRDFLARAQAIGVGPRTALDAVRTAVEGETFARPDRD
ncbi:GntR family transcriptional regulator [Nocardioides campestrisoli]|uniref:GntR family transcriptional regulator n=1 Tax=Nocardioides campestrisoli TaxID=2736757 RepID=UPI00163D5C8A|nr:GntR family transcriptional regulator [Nocardioides campestrisoli]